MIIKILAFVMIVMANSCLSITESAAEEIYFDSKINSHLIDIDVKNLWKLSLGEGVRVCVIDTGFTKVDKNFINIGSGIDIKKNISTEDINGHGTAVSTIIASPIESSSKILGVAPLATVIPIKIGDNSQSISAIDIAKGINWGVENGCSILNISVASFENNKLLKDAVARAERYDIPVIASVSNVGKNVTLNSYPSSYPEVFAISSLSKEYKSSLFSERNINIIASEIGEDILAPNLNGENVMHEGTSFSTAIFSGKIAIIKSIFPEISNLELSELIIKYSTNFSHENKSEVGFGLFDVYEAVKFLESNYNKFYYHNYNLDTSYTHLFFYRDISNEEFLIYGDNKKISYVIKENMISIKGIYKKLRIESPNRYYLKNLNLRDELVENEKLNINYITGVKKIICYSKTGKKYEIKNNIVKNCEKLTIIGRKYHINI